ncbi:hypothetical protein DL96DRAFT_1556754 [Flagelloscypha sp. PMI_526]|nr:hypothetical protein DL96DRAFT_1556754 [Flagelloscypha sp. PMI_526]
MLDCVQTTIFRIFSTFKVYKEKNLFVALKARHIEISRLDLHPMNSHGYSTLLVSEGQIMGWSLRVLDLAIALGLALKTVPTANYLNALPFLHTFSIRFVFNDLREWTPQLSTLAVKLAQLDQRMHFLRKIEIHLSCNQMEDDEAKARAILPTDSRGQTPWQEFDETAARVKGLEIFLCTNAKAETTHREGLEKILGDCMKCLRDGGRLEIVPSIPIDYF